MPHFTFKAKKNTGEIYTSVRDAADRYEMYKMVRDTGDELISYKEYNSGSFSRFFSRLPFSFGVKTHDKIIFARSLGSMLEAGLSVSHALTVLGRQAKNRTMKKVISDLNDSISKGIMLSQSLAEHTKVFSPLFISMVKSGEQSGTLTQSLKSITSQMESTYALQRRVRGAMIYPMIILLTMVLIAILMLTYIVPTLMKTFSELKLDLPVSTKIVLGASNLILNHGLVVLLTLIVAGILAYLWSQHDQGKRYIHFVILKIPIIGEIIKEVNSARTARTLSSLMGSGVDIVEAIHITSDVLQNVHYKKILDTVGETIKKGEPISKVFAENPKFYPIFLSEMIVVGEETGKIGEMLLNVATFYEEDVAEKTKDMSTVVEPFLMVVIGAAVGFFALAMISPMYSLVNVI